MLGESVEISVVIFYRGNIVMTRVASIVKMDDVLGLAAVVLIAMLLIQALTFVAPRPIIVELAMMPRKLVGILASRNVIRYDIADLVPLLIY
jgi:hypothetical protein